MNVTPAESPTIYFIGVSTQSSSIQRVFPAWADHLELDGAVLRGIDLPLHALAEAYRDVVSFLREDPLSLGALVTTHKIDLYTACEDLFDVIEEHARGMGEVSCLSKSTAGLHASAKDPVSSGLALEAFVPPGHWTGNDREVLSMGAGGSTIAIAWHLSRRVHGEDRPARIVVSNRSQPRLDALDRISRELGWDVPLTCVHTPRPEDNDALLAQMPPGSLVINATGLGKDAPGSPITDTAQFPDDGLAWDLNYRGDLRFLDQARAQAADRRLHVENGWVYFVHGWTQVIAEVFDIDIPTTGPGFDALSAIAAAARGGPVA